MCAGAAVGYFGTVAVSNWRTSEPSDNVPPKVQEERNEKQKKFEFEVQQRSNELIKKERELKALEEAVAGVKRH